MKRSQLNYLEKNNESFKNEEYIRKIIKYWNPQTMFKYIELYEKSLYKFTFYNMFKNIYLFKYLNL